MLDSLFTTLFNTYLGPYVENLDGSQLRLKLFTGTLTLRNIVIRPDALETLLDLPLRVVAGTPSASRASTNGRRRNSTASSKGVCPSQ